MWLIMHPKCDHCQWSPQKVMMEGMLYAPAVTNVVGLQWEVFESFIYPSAKSLRACDQHCITHLSIPPISDALLSGVMWIVLGNTSHCSGWLTELPIFTCHWWPGMFSLLTIHVWLIFHKAINNTTNKHHAKPMLSLNIWPSNINLIVNVKQLRQVLWRVQWSLSSPLWGPAELVVICPSSMHYQIKVLWAIKT